MQKIIKETIREVKEEVVAVQITAEEFCDIASKECTKMFLEMSSEGEPSVLDAILPMVCAKYAAHLMATIFHKDEENEEREEDKNA